MNTKSKMSSEEMPSPARSYKRKLKSVLIHKPLQREFMFVVIALLMISSLAIGLVIHRTIHEAMLGGGFRFGTISPYEVLSDVSYLLILRVAAILFVTLLILAAFGVFFLHRIAGPVYRFRQVFLKLNRGEIPDRIKLREGDFFVETADEINHLLNRLESNRDRSKRMKAKLDEIVAQSPPEPVSQKAREMRELLEEGGS